VDKRQNLCKIAYNMHKNIKEKKVKYYLNPQGEFVIENYNHSKPFANFFPGIAGKYGIPMWVFYVNRGQTITSFGIMDKNHSMLEFFPANKAWQLVSSQGFRTFLKVSTGKKTHFYEPFHNGFSSLEFNLANRMFITSHGLAIEEDNLSLGIRIKVEYFNIPNEDYAGLARVITLKNLSRSAKKIQLLDGLPQIVPFGTSNLFLKKLGRTIEAWMKVDNLDKGVPFYKLNVDPTDRPEVIHIKRGNFYLGFHYNKAKPEIIRPIVDPEYIFGPVTDFSCPRQFLAAKKFASPKKEVISSKTPCAFLLSGLELNAGEAKTFYSLVGYIRNQEALNSSISKIIAPGYLNRKKEENKEVIEGLQQDISTKTSSPEFDLYCKQTYLDNILRGGYPLVFKTGSSNSVFYLYSRKHGDLERDYNKFQLDPTYYSQGNGNYRDVNQNRRCDIWFNPEIKDENLVYFFNLLQADGFNPLVTKGTSFILKESVNLEAALAGMAEKNQLAKIASYLNKPFTPGDIIYFIEENGIKLNSSYDDFLKALFSCSVEIQEAEHGEGFWTDHWAYNLDLMETYLGVYPEKLKEILFEKKVFTYYDNSETVKPRREKYLLYNGLPRQLHSLATDNEKEGMIAARPLQAHVVRAQYGKGDIYRTTLISKLLCLVANKISSLDPFGVGIEMEANKPNWYDALNGLPALFGSSLCETLELKRFILFIADSIGKTNTGKINVTEEVRDFLAELDKLIRECLSSGSGDKDFQYWDKSYSLKEDYRVKTRFGFSGNETEINASELSSILDNALKKLDDGIKKALDTNNNIYYAYFINEVTEYQSLQEPFIKPLKFTQKKVPFFLESQMHAIRLTEDADKARVLYKAVKNSELFDKKLKMYKVTAPLAGMPEEIGRCRAFTPGWLESESIWLHMEYKYLLEILRHGLYEEFYQDFKNVLVPFQNPKNYGRSILENSSFLVSSVFPDKKLHGNGFVARLSGSTAEFLQIWLTMNLGMTPFRLDKNGGLNLQFNPILAGWLFNKKYGIYSFNFLSNIKVTYHNSKKKDTFGKNAVTPKEIILDDKDGNLVKIAGNTIPSPYAQQIRSRLIKQIDIVLE